MEGCNSKLCGYLVITNGLIKSCSNECNVVCNGNHFGYHYRWNNMILVFFLDKMKKFRCKEWLKMEHPDKVIFLDLLIAVRNERVAGSNPVSSSRKDKSNPEQ